MQYVATVRGVAQKHQKPELRAKTWGVRKRGVCENAYRERSLLECVLTYAASGRCVSTVNDLVDRFDVSSFELLLGDLGGEINGGGDVGTCMS